MLKKKSRYNLYWEKNGSESLIFYKDGLWYRLPGCAPAKGLPGKYHMGANSTLFTIDPTVKLRDN